MSDNTEQTETESTPSELELLKNRARMMGITFSNNIGLESLKAKVAEKMKADEDPMDQPAEQPEPNGFEAAAEVASQNDSVEPFGEGYKPQLDHDGNGFNGGSLPHAETTAAAETPVEAPAPAAPAKPMTLRQKLIKENMRLIRCRITNLDPKKKDLHGEVLTVANKYLGTVRKFIPYGEVTDDGFHVPYVLFKQLEKKRFLHIRTTRDRRTGAPQVHTTWAKEFAIEVLPPLTREELDRLATAQAAAGSVD